MINKQPKRLIAGLILGALLVAPFAYVRAASEPNATNKLNIVFLLADDLRPDGLGILGNPVVKTPNIDKLLENGFIFRNAHTLGSDSAAVCLPSRTMIQTGMSYLRKKITKPTLAQTVTGAGYASIRSGKGGPTNPNKFDVDFTRHIDDGAGMAGPGRDATFHANNLIAFVKEYAGKKPLFLYMASHEPHDPQYAPAKYYPMFSANAIPLPQSFLPYHPFDNGDMRSRDELTLPFPRTRENVCGKLARYYASTTYWDAEVGRLIQALKDAGQYDNTIFIVAGDNGLSLGEHGLIGKQNLYEYGGVHVPLIFAGPGIKKGETQAFCYLYDVYPTMCELVGIPVPPGLDAQSLVPILKNEKPAIYDCQFAAYKQCQRSIRADRWKLIRYPLIDKTQLFDLQTDPHEKNDLAANPEYADKIKQLTALLEKTQQQYGDTAPLVVPNPQPAAWSPDKVGGGKAGGKKGQKPQED